MSTLTDRMALGILGTVHPCDGELILDYSAVFNVANYLYSIWTFAL
jgi:hypothetical protein